MPMMDRHDRDGEEAFVSAANIRRVAGLFRAWGASDNAAPVMAKQLLRRAWQRSRADGTQPLAALQALLAKAAAGRAGGLPPGAGEPGEIGEETGNPPESGFPGENSC